MGLTITPVHPGAVTITPSGLSVSVSTPTPPGPVTVNTGLRGPPGPPGEPPADKPTLRSFDWWVTGEGNQPATMTDRAGDVDGVYVGGYQAKVIAPDAWEGSGLLGVANMDAPIDAWSDNNWRFVADVTIPPHWATGAGQWCELIHAPVDIDDQVNDYIEWAFIFYTDGTLGIGVDWDAVGGMDTLWESAPVGDWRVGERRATWETTVVDNGGGSYTFEVIRDGVVLQTDTVTGLDPFTAPDPGAVLQAGNVGDFALVLHSVSMLDPTDGVPMFAFDSAAPAGWTPTVNAMIVTAPGHASWFTPHGGIYRLVDPAVFDIGADDSVTWMWRTTVLPDQGPMYGRNWLGMLVDAEPGWVLVDATGFGLPHLFMISDGTAPVTVDVGVFAGDTETTIEVVLDRDTGTLTAYRDGATVDSVDASTLGAVATDGPVDVGAYSSPMLTATAGFARRALTAVEAATLHTEVSAAPHVGVYSLNGETGDIILDTDTVDLTGYETETGAQAKVDGHSADTTSVHGIDDTTLLETESGAQAKVDAAIAALLDSAPGALDTLNELAAALGDDANFAATVTTALAGKQPLDSDLTAIAALTTTAFGRSLLEAADAATARSTLGVVTPIGIKAPVSYLFVPGGTPTGTNTSVVPSAGRLNSELWSFDETTTLDRIGFEVSIAGATGSLLRIAVYAADDSTFMPTGAPIIDVGTQATDTPGLILATISQAFTRGRYVAQWITTGGATLKNVGVQTRSMGFVNVAAAGNNQNLVFTPNASPGFVASQPFPTPPVPCVIAGANGLQQHYIRARRT